MTRLELRAICTALSFLAVAQHNGKLRRAAKRAAALSLLMEAFIMDQMPEAFPEEEKPSALSRSFRPAK